MSSNHRRPEERPLVTAMGESKTLLEWSQDPRCIVSYDTLRQRLVRGWRMYRAMTTSVRDARLYALEDPVPDPVPSRTYGNSSMPSGSLTLPAWNVRAGSDAFLSYPSRGF